MRVQFLYHPENDAFVADKIIAGSGLDQCYSLHGLRISDINCFDDELLAAISKSDVVVLLIGSTFHRIAKGLWMHALQHHKGLLGINICSLPDRWGETRKKPGTWRTEAFRDGQSVGSLCAFYDDIPQAEEGYRYIGEHIGHWVQLAIASAENNYDL